MMTKSIPSVLFLLVWILSGCHPESESDFTVMKGKFVQTFTETGELTAINAVGLTIPEVDYRYGYEFKILGILDNGTKVSAGDTVVKIDDSSIRKMIITLEDELEKENAALEKTRVESTNALQDLQAQLRSEEARYDLIKLEMERTAFEPVQKQKVKQLEFSQATIRLEKIRRHLRDRPQLNEYDLTIQRTRILQKQAELEGAIDALRYMNIVAPTSGLFQLGSGMFSSGSNLKVGDAVYPGMLIARIPDVSRMKVVSWVHETEISKLALGTEAIIRMDALRSLPFSGHVTYINRISILKDNERVFKVEVLVDESDIRLKPGMTVSCEFIAFEEEGALFVPNNCIYQQNKKTWVLVDHKGKSSQIPVKAIRANAFHTCIEGDLKAGQALLPVESILNPE